eukprot:COSAG06_NODE_1013_length_11079_cov_7.729053_3_plen_78_part_00
MRPFLKTLNKHVSMRTKPKRDVRVCFSYRMYAMVISEVILPSHILDSPFAIASLRSVLQENASFVEFSAMFVPSLSW